jgi:hypothetical protein
MGNETPALTCTDDAKLAGDADFMKWIADLEQVMRDWGAKYGNVPYEIPLAESTGLWCWHPYYADDYSPEDAFSEDQTYWGDC